MLLKISCVAVLIVLGEAIEYRDHRGDALRPQYRDEDSDHYENYQTDDSDDLDSIRVKRFESKPTVKTLSPREIQEVRGAINLILSGYNQDHPFTPLPPMQPSDEKRSISLKQVIHKPRSVGPSYINYAYNAATKFNDNTDVIDNTGSGTRTIFSEPITTDDPSNKPLPLTTDQNYYADDFIGATANVPSSLPTIILDTDDVIKTALNTAVEKIVADNDITEKAPETINYEIETDAGLTGATINAMPMTIFTPIDNTNTRDDIKSEINNILGLTDNINNTTLMRRGLADINKNHLVRATTNNLPMHWQEPGFLRTESVTVEQDAHVPGTPVANENNSEVTEMTDSDSDKEEQQKQTTPQLGTQQSKHPDVTIYQPGAGPESVTEVAAIEEAEHEKGVGEGVGGGEGGEGGGVEGGEGGGAEGATGGGGGEKGEGVAEGAEGGGGGEGVGEGGLGEGGGEEEGGAAGEVVGEGGEGEGGGEVQHPGPTKKEENNQPTRTKTVPSKGQSQQSSTPSKHMIFTRPTRTRTTRTTTTTTTTTRTTTTKFQLDVPALLAIIANLTYDYEMNLTDNLNATLLKYSIPTCETPTTTQKSGIFVDYEANATGTIVAKCFVCGLEVEKIPRNAHCADAFAGDFLPLVPVDMTARGKISKYRKYCRFADVPHYLTNETQPRSVFGRWTGGCSVRWIDLSGVYTQRSCRNRERAILGRHFASKRMAKLEMALSHVDNGCIASPMATLVPLSRGISLYARFHACVCTGSWCNAADLRVPWYPPWTEPWSTGGFLPLLVAYISQHWMI